MKFYEFDSRVQYLDVLGQTFTDKQIKNEPMMFSCDYVTAWVKAGPITKAVLKLFPADWKGNDVLIDSRVHMLMPGFYPCIPGWHHDDVPRTRADGQPNYDDPNNKAEHLMILVNGEIAPTEFAIGQASFPDISHGRVYDGWHREVERKIFTGELRRWSAPSDMLIKFDHNTFHRGVPALDSGWRFFLRAAKNSDRKAKNETRRQVQVYLDSVNQGW